MLGDSEIMQSTFRDGGKIKYTLPDGQVMEGPAPDKMSASSIQGWCDTVRRNLEIVHANQRQRKAPRPNEGVTDQGTRAEPKPVVAEEDPVAYAAAQFKEWSERFNRLDGEIANLTDARDEAKSNGDKWHKIMEALT